MNDINENSPQHGTVWHFSATEEEYIACIRVLLSNKEIPLTVLQEIYHILLQA